MVNVMTKPAKHGPIFVTVVSCFELWAGKTNDQVFEVLIASHEVFFAIILMFFLP